jgi:hypothetical protein
MRQAGAVHPARQTPAMSQALFPVQSPESARRLGQRDRESRPPPTLYPIDFAFVPHSKGRLNKKILIKGNPPNV